MVNSAFSPARMAECDLPFIPAIEGDLVTDCFLCVTTPTPLFNPVLPLIPPPSFDFGCYAVPDPFLKKLTRGQPDDDGQLYGATMTAKISFVDVANVGYCRPQIRMKVRFSDVWANMWDACGGPAASPFIIRPFQDFTDEKPVVCCFPSSDCLMGSSSKKWGTIAQFARVECEYLKLVLADKSATQPKDNIKASFLSATSPDMMDAHGYVDMAFSPCNIAFHFVCDVYCDATTLVVAYRRAYFQRGILIWLDPYDDVGTFVEDTTWVGCPGGPAPC